MTSIDTTHDDALREIPFAKEDIYNGRILHVEKWKVTCPNGREAAREIVVHKGAAAVVPVFENGDTLLEAFRQEPAELVILDIMMPGTDGLAVCRELRSVSDIPIILLTAKDSELDYVMGISQGSDDYLTKPFRPTILLMKVRALLRRVEMDRGKTAAAVDELRYGDLRYSATENAVFCGSTIVALTQTELRLLSYMMKQPEKAYSREELLSAVWGFDSEVETRVTDETLRRIRKKLTQSGSTVSVSTIWGFGYKLKGAERT